MLILVTNDDGVDAPGLRALELFAQQLGDVVVIAPDGPRSGFSHSVTMYDSMELKQLDTTRFACSGTPADCVRVGLKHLGLKPDWVLSGVNLGANLGVDMYMSGTVAAAREAAIMGIPAFAFSNYYCNGSVVNWDIAREACGTVFRDYEGQSLSHGEFWNVNLPDPLCFLAEEVRTVEVAPDPSPLPLAYLEEGGVLQYKSHYHERPRLAGFDVQQCMDGAITVSRVLLFEQT